MFSLTLKDFLTNPRIFAGNWSVLKTLRAYLSSHSYWPYPRSAQGFPLQRPRFVLVSIYTQSSVLIANFLVQFLQSVPVESTDRRDVNFQSGNRQIARRAGSENVPRFKPARKGQPPFSQNRQRLAALLFKPNLLHQSEIEISASIFSHLTSGSAFSST